MSYSSKRSSNIIISLDSQYPRSLLAMISEIPIMSGLRDLQSR